MHVHIIMLIDIYIPRVSAMKALVLSVLLLGAMASAHARDYLVYGVEVVQDGKTALSGEATLENGQQNPAIFSNVVTAQPKVDCKSNVAFKLNPVGTGFQLELQGNILGDGVASVAMNYKYRKGMIGQWVDAGLCRYQQPVEHIDYVNPAAILRLGERLRLTSSYSDIPGDGPQSYEVFVTLKAIKRDVAVPLQPGFVMVTQ